MKIARVMSTQHPDNASVPFFATNDIMQADDEVKEAFHAFSKFGCDEQLWDAEGKEVDAFVVKKLFTNHQDYFTKHKLGVDKFLTFRVPNPDVEKNEGKILLESLHSIPRNFDIGKVFYNQDIAPIFEVVIPMCFSEKNMIRVYKYYTKYIVGNQHNKVHDISIKEWLGASGPDTLRVTPLFETKDAILNADKYVEKYIDHAKIQELQRVWFARSDPALNYGSTSAVLLGKIGLQRLHALQEKRSIEILPMLGCGSAPFRGNFTPNNVSSMLKAYPSMQTFTAQSAFKYDYRESKVQEAISTINDTKRKSPVGIDEQNAMKLIDKMQQDYTNAIKILAPTINQMSNFVPSRRKRKLHIDLFGYARESAGVCLPRAIKFCASLYSLGLPPDVLGISALSENEIDSMRESYTSLDQDMARALSFVNLQNLSFFDPTIQRRVKRVLELFEHEINKDHQAATTNVLHAFRKQDRSLVTNGIIESATIRQFLG